MKLTSARTATTVTLVDPAVGGFQPVPPIDVQQIFEIYQIEGGRTKRTAHGTTSTMQSPAVVLIDQATDAAAQAILQQLAALIADPTEQPVTVQWNDYHPGGIWDGPYWIGQINTAEVETDFRGRLKPTLPMVPV